MTSQLEKIIMCPLCFKTMRSPIRQCETGHSMCGACIDDSPIKTCRQCHKPISSIRNYQLEQMIENMGKLKLGKAEGATAPCHFAEKGCKEMLTPAEKGPHEEECKHRKFLCEGRKFAKWKCEWFGTYRELERHFKEAHVNDVEYKTQKDVALNLRDDHRDVQIISFFNGAQYFWYKHMVDVSKEKVYWVFQYIGPQRQAKNYYYEFEISGGPIRKFKVTEICDNDVVKAEKLFKEERCVVLSFRAVRSYLNEEGKLPIKFRIMHVKKHNEPSS
ncbi:Sina and/or zf-RING 6 domain containing protein [Asbolus verrucosus]|uniref:E3 ubiquitin-protein ligase n=1 Tax=Asbolus verrucosus TaxID=1661398 RepID=A0A482V8T9_ASBVE|nr:Sina and/or zf-RING 6 domain containing protein [Asbolus verrucosus]